MYRVNVLSRGKYDNVETGSRYCLTAKRAVKFCNKAIKEWGCEATIDKFIKCGDMWVWSENALCWDDKWADKLANPYDIEE